MRKFWLRGLVVCCCVTGLTFAQQGSSSATLDPNVPSDGAQATLEATSATHVSPFDPNVEDLNVTDAPPLLGIVWARGMAPQRTALTADPDMSYHGGKIMPIVTSKSIFWGTGWANYTGDKMTGLDQWYTGHNGSNYAATVNEYTGTNGQVGSTGLVHQGHVVDTTTSAGGNDSSAILREVCRQISLQHINPDMNGNGYYPVYVDKKRGNAGYCAWHSAGVCSFGGTIKIPVQFAFFFNLDGDPGCDPGDNQTGNSQGLAALANVTAHEIEEARSDPANPGAWYDSGGSENGDKCVWTFNVPYVTFPDGHKWKLQGEWSNAAYDAGTGYPNSSGQRGCLDGH